MASFKDHLTESLNKEYSFRVKIAADCGSEHMTCIEDCLAKYNLVSVAPFKRKPISENPIEFPRTTGNKFVSEVCSTDIVIKYPVNPKILEVWLAVNLGLDHDRVVVYGVKEPRRAEADCVASRVEYNEERQVSEEDAVLNKEDQAHYEMECEEVDMDGPLFGEAYNDKFLAELQKIKDEKGADYFRNYPDKDNIMGYKLKSTYDALHNLPNMGSSNEDSKEAAIIHQAGGK